MSVPVPTFAPGDRPSDILDGAGRWLAAELGWLRMMDADTIEWALACGDREAAEALLRARLWRADMSEESRAIMFEQFRVGWELAPDRDRWLPWAVESLGWLARVHQLISIDEVPHPGDARPSKE